MKFRNWTAQWIIKPIVRLFFVVAYRLEVRGHEKLPAEGGFLVAANHVSFFDPPVIGVATKRLVTFTPRTTLNQSLVYRMMTALVPIIPIARGSPDMATTRRVVEFLKDGNIIGIFPEETRSANGTLGPLKRGVHLLSSRSKVVVVPTVIRGSYEAWPRHRKWPRFGPRLSVRFGTPLALHEMPREEGLTKLRASLIELGAPPPSAAVPEREVPAKAAD